MGSGVSSSSTMRLRKAIVIRAYNLRKADETLDEQFRVYAKRDPSQDNKLTITLQDVKKCLHLDDEALWASVEELFHHCVGVTVRNLFDMTLYSQNSVKSLSTMLKGLRSMRW